jgi:hypothetical protein
MYFNTENQLGRLLNRYSGKGGALSNLCNTASLDGMRVQFTRTHNHTQSRAITPNQVHTGARAPSTPDGVSSDRLYRPAQIRQTRVAICFISCALGNLAAARCFTLAPAIASPAQ